MLEGKESKGFKIICEWGKREKVAAWVVDIKYETEREK